MIQKSNRRRCFLILIPFLVVTYTVICCHSSWRPRADTSWWCDTTIMIILSEGQIRETSLHKMWLKLAQHRKRPIHFHAINSDKIELPPWTLGPSFHSVTFILIFMSFKVPVHRPFYHSGRPLSLSVNFGIRHLTRTLSHGTLRQFKNVLV